MEFDFKAGLTNGDFNLKKVPFPYKAILTNFILIAFTQASSPS